MGRQVRQRLQSWAAVVVAGLLAVGCAGLPAGLESPYVSLVDVAPLEMTLFEQRYRVRLRIQNPNNDALAVTGVDFRLDLNEREFARGVSGEAVTVPAYGEAVVEVAVVSTLFRMFEQLRNTERAERGQLSYRMHGGLRLGDRLSKVPFEAQGTLGGGDKRGEE